MNTGKVLILRVFCRLDLMDTLFGLTDALFGLTGFSVNNGQFGGLG